MSIYISIPTLEDYEIENTVASAIENASTEVHVGVAFMTSKTFFNFISNKLNYKNIRKKWFDPKYNAGVAIGRKNSLSMYSGEKYFLQVDSHTKFEYEWDKKLISLYEKCLEKTNNDKTIMTSYLGYYRKKNQNIREVLSSKSRYSVFANTGFDEYIILNRWYDIPIDDFPKKFRTNELIIPSNKINAQMIFSDENFVVDNGLPENILFFEEEIIQSINLFDRGFSIAFPNSDLPLTHLYYEYENIGKRQSYQDLESTSRYTSLEISSNFYDFIYNEKNIKKCKSFEEHSKYKIYKEYSKPFYIPKNFSTKSVDLKKYS